MEFCSGRVSLFHKRRHATTAAFRSTSGTIILNSAHIYIYIYIVLLVVISLLHRYTSCLLRSFGSCSESQALWHHAACTLCSQNPKPQTRESKSSEVPGGLAPWGNRGGGVCHGHDGAGGAVRLGYGSTGMLDWGSGLCHGNLHCSSVRKDV